MLNYLKEESNMTMTENGAVSHVSTMSDCLDLFATIGALRNASDDEIINRFTKAFAEDRDIAMKILFFGRDVRGGLGERRVFRVIINWLAKHEAESLRRNIELIPEYGRYDDLLALIGTDCEKSAYEMIAKQLAKDLANDKEVSLLAKWLPSVNASSSFTVKTAKRIARHLKMTDAEYRKVLVRLRKKISIIENNLREKDYSFEYSKQPSKAMFKYRKAFTRNDGKRYGEFLNKVVDGTATMHTGTLMPYEIIDPCFDGRYGVNVIPFEERKSMDVTWNALENFGTDENAIVVVDGSGSMYGWSKPLPITVALSLGIYFAERNNGYFKNHFITFSKNPQLVEIKGKDIYEKVRYCSGFCEVANTDIKKVFELILNAAVKNNIRQEELPSKIYIVSDMEFDRCVDNSRITNFEYARKLFDENGYKLPEVVFWNVASRNNQQPVTRNEQGVALVSGCTPKLFSMIAGGVTSPYTIMMGTIGSERYAPIAA